MRTYNYTGSLQAYTVPSDGSVTSINVTLAGGSGGTGGYYEGGSGGSGGQVTANIQVTPGAVYYLVVGGVGINGGVSTDGYGHSGGSGGGGGGKSFITTTNNSTMDGNAILVAGAGGGGGGTQQFYSVASLAGGSGGWPNGGPGGSCGSAAGCGGGGDGYYGGSGGSGGSGYPAGGTQSSGYAYGVGGPGPSNLTGYEYGVGSFGGNGGSTSADQGSNGYSAGSPALSGGGAGGSSYVSSSTSITPISNVKGANSGNGFITITEIGPVYLPLIIEQEVENEYIQTSGSIKKIDIIENEQPYECDFPSLGRQRFTTDTAIQIATSSYKWLTSTLFNAQNQFTVRPSISCQIVDETLLVNQQMYNNQNPYTAPGFSGDAVIAPDGSILAVGQDTAGNLRFAKITDGTQFSQWNQILNDTGGVIIANNLAWEWNNPRFTSNGFHLNASLAVSDWIAGSYTIDIYYWVNNLSYFEPARARSTDGGVTFTNYTDINLSVSLDTSFAPIQIQAGKPVYLPSTGKTSAAAFILAGTGAYTVSNLFYYNYTADGTSFSGGTGWSLWGNNPPFYSSTVEWSLHSFDAEYINGVYYFVFSGYHTAIASTNPAAALSASSNPTDFFGNYGLYSMQLRQSTETGGPPSFIFTEPREVLVFNSPTVTNTTQALYPGLNYDGSTLWLNYRLDQTSSVSENSSTTISTNYYLSRSIDLKNFEYPTTILDLNGNSIVTPSVSTTYYNGLNKYAFVGNQNGYYYFWGDGALWQFVQNQITADVSGDILGVQIQDQSGGASSLNLTIANGGGKWAGSSPTGTNYQAIWKNGQANKNSKVYLQLGYYTSIGSGETVPRNIYYITDITQSVSSTTNDLVIVGQDWNKLLSTTQTAFTYNFQGPDMYFEPFSTVTVPSWTQTTGTWVQVTPSTNNISTPTTGNIFVPYSSYTNTATGSSSPSYTTALTSSTLAVLSGFTITHPEITFSGSIYIPTGMAYLASIDFYPWYLNSNNYIKVSFVSNGSNVISGTVNQTWNGQQQAAISMTGTFTTAGNWYPVFIRLYGYGSRIDTMLGYADSYGNSVDSFISANIYTGSSSSETTLNLPPYYSSLNGQLPTIAIGTTGSINAGGSAQSTAYIYTAFYNLRFTQNTYSQTIQELTERLGTLAHIFDYLPEKDYVQDLYDSSQWNLSGGASLPNRTLTIASQNTAIQNTQQYSDGQIEFDAKVSASTFGESFGFDFVFRSQSQSNLNNCYKIRVMNSNNNGAGYLVKASLLQSNNTVGSYTDNPLFSSIIPDMIGSNIFTKVTYYGGNNLEIDLTQLNHYQIAFNKGWVYLFVNGIEVLAWYDNNNIITYSSGYWGFSTINDGTLWDNSFARDEILTVQNIFFPTFWQQINVFSLNPGDEISQAITTNLQTVYGWNFSDLGGRMKLITLKTTDAISYYYGDGATNYLLYSVSNDSSDKEYYNQVLVVGDGVSYLASDNTSVGTNGVLREEVIVDYTITTLAAATTRANQELASIQQYGTQPAPQLNINVGSEVFDAVNIVSNSTNTAMGLNGNYRVYTQSFNIDNQSNYNITLGTGSITSNS